MDFSLEYLYPSGSARLDRLRAQPSADELSLLGGDGVPTFKDLLDVINPLQQLPIIGDLYRQLTGENISAGARIAGGFLLGGPVGFMTAAINSGLEAATGADAVEHVVAFLGFGSGETQYAAAQYQKANQLSS